MISPDDELAKEYLTECCEDLATIETDLLAIGKGGPEKEAELVNRVFRRVHAIGLAGFFDLVKIRDLAQGAEEVLALIRLRKMAVTPHRIRVLLRAAGKLRELVENPGSSNQANITEIMAALARLKEDQKDSAEKSGASAAKPSLSKGRPLRLLLVEDDVASRLLLQTFLSRYGECHVAVNGREAVEKFRSAFDGGQTYDLICMDIMMPEMDGREAVRQIRALEETHGTLSSDGAKIIMTTAVDDVREVIGCFKDLCDVYLIKPVVLDQLLGHMKAFKLL